MEKKHAGFESSFDINRISFDNVSNSFEKEFKEKYNTSLGMMSNSRDRLTNASGANSLGILEEMARHIKNYDDKTSFKETYNQIQKNYGPFMET